MRQTVRRCGYVKEAHWRQAWPGRDGTLYDSIGYAILRTDWQAGTITRPDWDDEPSAAPEDSGRESEPTWDVRAVRGVRDVRCAGSAPRCGPGPAAMRPLACPGTVRPSRPLPAGRCRG